MAGLFKCQTTGVPGKPWMITGPGGSIVLGPTTWKRVAQYTIVRTDDSI